jgi:hypothetical protein
MMNILDEAGILREVKVMSKAKTPTKTAMPRIDGPTKMETTQSQREAAANVDVVIHDPSTPKVVIACFLWQRYDKMVISYGGG